MLAVVKSVSITCTKNCMKNVNAETVLSHFAFRDILQSFLEKYHTSFMFLLCFQWLAGYL